MNILKGERKRKKKKKKRKIEKWIMTITLKMDKQVFYDHIFHTNR